MSVRNGSTSKSPSVTAEFQTSSLLDVEPELPSLAPTESELEKGQKGTKLRVEGLNKDAVNGGDGEVDGDEDEGDRKRCRVRNEDDVQWS